MANQEEERAEDVHQVPDPDAGRGHVFRAFDAFVVFVRDQVVDFFDGGIGRFDREQHDQHDGQNDVFQRYESEDEAQRDAGNQFDWNQTLYGAGLAKHNSQAMVGVADVAPDVYKYVLLVRFLEFQRTHPRSECF